MATKELVLNIGCEGGGAEVYRTPLASGGFQFHVEGNSMFLDENDDEAWRDWKKEPVETIQAALRSISPDGSWIYFFPIMVHPEYGKAVWQCFEEALRARANDSDERRHRSRQKWLAACSVK